MRRMPGGVVMRILSFLILLAAMSAAWGDTPIYKWVDDKGQVHYSTEPHGDNAQQLNIVNKGTLPSPTTAPAAASANSPAQDAALVAPTPKDSASCKSAREQLSKFLNADSLYRTDASGNRQPLSAADKQKTLDDARNIVKQACGPGGQ